MRMAWEDARNETSVFESFERPFVFENLPSPALGRLKMRLEAMDEFGRVLPNAEMNIDLDVVPENDAADPAVSDRSAAAASEPVDTTLTSLAADEPLPALTDEGPFMAQAILADTFTPIRIQAEGGDADDGTSAVISGNGINVVDDPVSQPNAVNADDQAYVDYGDGDAGGETLTFTFSVAEAGSTSWRWVMRLARTTMALIETALYGWMSTTSWLTVCSTCPVRR